MLLLLFFFLLSVTFMTSLCDMFGRMDVKGKIFERAVKNKQYFSFVEGQQYVGPMLLFYPKGILI